jgi:hypothetical protein
MKKFTASVLIPIKSISFEVFDSRSTGIYRIKCPHIVMALEEGDISYEKHGS